MNAVTSKVTETGLALLREIAPTQAVTDLTQKQINLILSVQGKLEQGVNGKWYVRSMNKREKRGFFHINRFAKRFSTSEN